MRTGDLVRHYPRLYHLSEADAWASIARHGLLPTSQIVGTSGLPPQTQVELLARPRAGTTYLEHPELGPVALRDQSPLRPRILAEVLDGMTPREWLTELNDRVFFWLDPRKLDILLGAQRNRGRDHDVLVVDTASVMDAHGDAVTLSPINSGATLYPNAPRRGRGTFLPVGDYPFDDWRRRRPRRSAITELAVTGGVPDIRQHTIAVHRRRGPDIVRIVHECAAADRR